jgi:hypothetical protein
MVQNKQNSEAVAKKDIVEYLFLATASQFCLFCTIQHYYNIFFWPLLHYFVYSVAFNITTKKGIVVMLNGTD